MTRDEQLIRAALEMAASKAHDTCPECGYRTDASDAIRAIDVDEVLAGLPPVPDAVGEQIGENDD